MDSLFSQDCFPEGKKKQTKRTDKGMFKNMLPFWRTAKVVNYQLRQNPHFHLIFRKVFT